MRAKVGVAVALGEAEASGFAESELELLIGVAVPEMLKPAMIRVRVATPEAAPMATCFKYANLALPSDTTDS
ncbi:unannotated protein [freshwater metagenome]|uniref:Unannotated protein n=1 Tax=freshwater metagenome TaxID=449393 RepID=A0A6J6MW50_9ZZZZ